MPLLDVLAVQLLNFVLLSLLGKSCTLSARVSLVSSSSSSIDGAHSVWGMRRIRFEPGSPAHVKECSSGGINNIAQVFTDRQLDEQV
jgi:hypothetical protein